MCDVPLILVWHVYTVSSISILDSSVFCVHELTVSCCCRGFLFCSVSASKDLFSMICSRPVPFEDSCTISLNTSAQDVKLSAHDLSSCWSLRKLKIGFLVPKYELLQSKKIICLVALICMKLSMFAPISSTQLNSSVTSKLCAHIHF